MKEIEIWSKLDDHPNVVAFEGLIIQDRSPSIVSRWAGNGTVCEYLLVNTNINLQKLVCDYPRIW